MSTATIVIDRLEARLDAIADDVAQYGPRSVPTGLRRDHVLIAASLCFVADGFDGVSMEHIADRAGVTKPVLYSLFDSKVDLFAAVIDMVTDEMAEAVGTAIAPEGESQLGAGIRAYLDYFSGQHQLFGPMFASAHRGEVAAALGRMQHRQVDVVMGSLGRGHRAAGLEPDDRELEALAHLVTGAVHAVSQWWHRHPEISIDEMTAFLTASLAPTLDALRTEHRHTVWFGTALRR
ncbi:MAG: TetR/AcrR family transcriptional regulator [Actinomycetota bacterium]